ncbi:DUF418 domain-containing protein [Aminobacter sp. UC22_36]|uniref:DUF418 domain-containing protein n=1 Tax=Aminobacter sp. UC22_36 TaxID=3374549 RepID=UPI0037583B8E
MTMMIQKAGKQERITDVDALRGFALFGILVVNITAFASPYYGLGVADPAFSGPVDRAVQFFIAMLFETKFYLLFSFLFGYSFTLQVQSAERAGEAFVPRLLRRQVGLWVIGLAHAVLLFHGDILTTYAVLGVVLLVLRDIKEATALRLAKWLVIGAAALWAIFAVLQLLDPAALDPATNLAEGEAAMAAYLGTPGTVIDQHLVELGNVWVVIGLMQGPSALAMFLVGLVAGKRRLFVRLDDYRPLLCRMLVAGLTIGLAGAAFYGWSSVYLVGTVWDLPGLAVGLLTAPLLTGAYVALAMLAFQGSRRLAGMLAPAGRMALSNYLFQSLVCATLFYAYGFRLMGEVSPLGGLLLAVAIFAVQLALSRWWMAHFVYGPLEWLLRAVTIAAWPSLRKQGTSAAASR